jgi:hypothetical protein
MFVKVLQECVEKMDNSVQQVSDEEARRLAQRDIDAMERELQDPEAEISFAKEELDGVMKDILGEKDQNKDVEPIDPYEDDDDEDEEDDSIFGFVGGAIGMVVGGIAGLIGGIALGAIIDKDFDDDDDYDDDSDNDKDLDDNDDEVDNNDGDAEEEEGDEEI